MSNATTTSNTIASIGKRASDLTKKLSPLAKSPDEGTSQIAVELQSVANAIAAISTDLTKALNSARSKPRSKAA